MVSKLIAGTVLLCAMPVLAQKQQVSEARTGSVIGTLTCADTNAPARFAVVTLERVPAEKDEAVKAAPPPKDGEFSMNATATTDLEGHFVLDKVPAGMYFVIGILSGYMGPFAHFDHDDVMAMSEATRKEMLQRIPVVHVEAGQTAQVELRLEHASELSGTVLYDDGSPAIHLRVRLLRKTKTGELASMDGIVIPGFGAQVETDDRGRFRFIGIPPGEYAISAAMRLEKTAFAGLLGGKGLSIDVWGDSGGEVKVYSGSKFRMKEAKTTKVGEGEQIGGLDITIPLAGLHRVQGTLTAKHDGHPLSHGRVSLLFDDDETEAQSTEIDREGNFEFPYVPEGRYRLRASDAEDVELIQKHEFNSNFTEEKPLKKYGQAEMPLLVQGDVSGLELATPDLTETKASPQ